MFSLIGIDTFKIIRCFPPRRVIPPNQRLSDVHLEGNSLLMVDLNADDSVLDMLSEEVSKHSSCE